MAQIPELQKLPTNTTLDEVIRVIVKNYGSFHELGVQHTALQNWIIEQRKLCN